MLQKLEVESLRGATKKFTLDFEKGKKITIIYGENASGKSSICDAVELLTKGKISSLEDKGLGKTESYWHSTGKKTTDVLVSLTSTTGQWSAKLSKSKAVVTPEVGLPRAAILRHRQILGLIVAQPKNRFDAVRPFLDIQSVEESEESLRRLVEQEKSSRITALARIEENRVAIDNFWKTASSSEKDALSWARQEISKDTAKIQEELELLEALRTALESTMSEQGRYVDEQANLKSAEKAHELIQERVTKERANLSEAVGDLVGILEAAKKYFHKHEHPETCPLCGSAEFVDGLPMRIEGQLSSIKSLTEALQLQATAQKNLEATKQQALKQANGLIDVAKKLAILITPTYLPSGLAYSSELRELAKGLTLKESAREDRLSLAMELATKAAMILTKVRSASDERKERKGFLQTLKKAVETYDSNYAVQKELDSLIPRLEQALTEIVAERQLFVNDILGKIADRVGKLYEAVHPGEGLSKISLLLDPAKRASLDILSPFHGAKDVPPGAYFSDSHLDTLGLCIWLALAELGQAEETILVLDDVVGSIDEPHVDRVIELLYDLAQNFQHCILTTHYRPWREKYRWGWLRNGQCHFVELLPWEHHSGIKHGKSLPPVEDLRNLLKEAQPGEQMACASAGVILEAILEFLTHLYECAVPRRKSKPTLGDLLPSIKGKLRTSLKIERQVLSPDGSVKYEEHLLGPLVEELEKIAQARNIFGCHFNELAQHLPPQDAVHFATTVLTLTDLLIDPECGWPKSDKSGSYWTNSKQTRRLHPLKHPN